MRGTGILAIWNDCAQGREAAYEDWYQSEHLPERLSVPGFLIGRRYEALTDGPQFLTYYEVANPAVLTSPAYLERLDNPTPRTREMMTQAFRNMSRTVCRRLPIQGASFGAYAVTTPSVVSGSTGPVDRSLGTPGVLARAERWEAVDALGSSMRAEEQLRGGDARITSCMLLEYLREADAWQAAKRLDGQLFRLLADQRSPQAEEAPV